MSRGCEITGSRAKSPERTNEESEIRTSFPVMSEPNMSTKAQKIKSETPRKFAVQHRNRCRLCGRPRGFYRKFGVCRICFRNLASRGLIPGVKKASW
jgi:small subunit ribosomal protein S14